MYALKTSDMSAAATNMQKINLCRIKSPAVEEQLMYRRWDADSIWDPAES